MSFAAFQELKLDIVSLVGLSKDALHIYVGLIVFLSVAAAARQGLRSRLPLLAVFIVALIGEALDMRDHLMRHNQLRLGGSVHDLLNTLFWPVVFWLLARYSRVMK